MVKNKITKFKIYFTYQKILNQFQILGSNGECSSSIKIGKPRNINKIIRTKHKQKS